MSSDESFERQVTSADVKLATKIAHINHVRGYVRELAAQEKKRPSRVFLWMLDGLEHRLRKLHQEAHDVAK